MRRILFLSGISAVAMALAWAIGLGAAVVMSPQFIAPPEDIQPPSNFSLYGEVWRHVDTEFYGERPDAFDISLGAVEGVVEAIEDPWSIVVPAADAAALGPRLAGAIGAWIEPVSDGARVLAVLPESQAETQGLQPADLIVNAEPIVGDSAAEGDFLAVDTLEPIDLAELLSSLPTAHSVIVVREGEAAFSVDFEPGSDGATEAVSHRELQPGVGYLQLGELTALSLETLDASLAALEGAASLVLDLRDNPGGDTESLEEIAARFLDGDLYATEGDGVEGDEGDDGTGEGNTTSVDGNSSLVPSVVLVNRGTGGTAEILAAALSERGVRLVGETTYGRDGIQEAVVLSDGTIIRMTTMRWRSPEGKNVAESGLAPDSEVSGRDAQLAAAVELVMASGAADQSGSATNGG